MKYLTTVLFCLIAILATAQHDSTIVRFGSGFAEDSVVFHINNKEVFRGIISSRSISSDHSGFYKHDVLAYWKVIYITDLSLV